MIDGLESYAISTLDPTGIILSWNKGAERAYGYGPNDAIGRHFGIMFPEEDRKTGAPARDLDSARANGKYETEGWQIDRLGQYRWHNSLTECIRDGEQNPVGFVRVCRFSPAAEARTNASTAPQFQREKLETLAHFTQRLIHDYNNLLTIVTSNLDRLDVGPCDAERARHLVEGALRAAQRAMALTHQLYLFSARNSAHNELIDAVELLHSLEAPMRVACGDGVELYMDVNMESAVVRLDPMDFEVALLNLVTNGCDALRGSGNVRIVTRGIGIGPAAAEKSPNLAPGRYISISVSDDGAGMPPEVLERAFEPFFTTKDTGAGSGLGLAQVYGFARQCGGHVDIQSAVGKGTTVTLTLPIVDRTTVGSAAR